MTTNKLHGFTLIEVMVAMVLMGMMGMLLMAAINSSLQAKDSVEDISSRYQLVRQALSRMSREISMAYLSKHMALGDPSYVTQFKGAQNRLYFSAFGNVVHQRDAKQSDQQVIGYYLATDKLGRQSLMRRFQANLNLDVEKGGTAQVLCPNVTKLEFSYYDSRYKKWEESWVADPTNLVLQGQVEEQGKGEKQEQAQNQAQTPKQWRLPSYVKITMTVDMQEGVPMTWVTETEIPLQEPLDLN
jgi:general secretion pathway protein J